MSLPKFDEIFGANLGEDQNKQEKMFIGFDMVFSKTLIIMLNFLINLETSGRPQMILIACETQFRQP